ncbi:hypothetical protein MFLAVUS_007007 [Mucor flavus]|uniref:Suppressor of white apricot N-terminal domain-containing protein n=1 Tax=Mucor flavus TaxID=439312 RepID=A0ABP9Z340_9FUNG
MVDHRKRAERRRAYYESRLGDIQQLIRVIGVSSKVYPDAEQFYYHENPDNLMNWQGNQDIKIDRFDGRSLLDFVPDASRGYGHIPKEEREMQDELNFERYHDLIEAERLNVSEADRLAEVDEEWTKLLDRHQAKLALINSQEKGSNTKSRGFGFDYGTTKVDILQYVDDLTDKDKQVLNEMSGKYGIRSYARLLRVAKKDRDDELRALKRQQEEGRPKDSSSKRNSNERRRLRRRGDRRSRNDDQNRYRRRYSPTYEPYRRASDSEESSADENRQEDSDFVIEFGSSAPEESNQQDDTKDKNTENQRSSAPIAPMEKKLTPLEKLKLKMRAGLEKQIVLDERNKREKEREKELENLRDLATKQGLPINAYMRPEPPKRENAGQGKTRYRSPSTSPTLESRSPSPQPTKSRYRSPTPSRSPSPQSHRKRYRSPSPSRHRSSRRSRSRDRAHSSRRSPSRDRYHRSSRKSSPKRDYRRHERSPTKKRHISPQTRSSPSPTRRQWRK